MHTRVAAVAIACLLCGCGGNGFTPKDKPKQPDVVSLSPQDWVITHSTNMPAHPAQSSIGAWYFDFPSSGSVNYIQVPYNQTQTHTNISITFRIDETNAVYGQADATDHNPATFHLYFERQGDDGTKDNSRWWPVCGITLAPYSSPSTFSECAKTVDSNGNTTVTVPLVFSQWNCVQNTPSDPCTTAGFQDALANVGWVGLTFGGQFFDGHGVYLTNGQSRFTLINYTVQ